MAGKPVAALVLILTLVLAGCASSPDDGTVPDAEPETIGTDVIETGPAVGPDLNATTAEAPRLIEGEWWRIRFDSDFYDAQGAEVLRVVANATDDGYIFGMPHENWLKEAISFHAPAFGTVAKDLSYDTHNERFAPLRFPLVAGDTWETSFATAPLVATVESADERTAEIVFRAPETDPTPQDTVMQAIMGGGGDGVFMRLTYDARLHEVSRMESFIGSWEVVEHGFSFRGWVSVPEGEHTAIDYGVFGPDANNPLPSRSVEVEEHFNRITVMHFISAISPGTFRLTSTSPNGTSFVTEYTGQAGSRTNFFEVANPGGTWTQEDLAAGAGATYTMGIAYQQYDILVPDGARRPTHGHEVVR